MVKYIFKRLLYMVFVFLIMTFILFFLYNLVPGDPARAELERIKDKLTPEEYQYRYEQARKRLGLDDPLIVRYGRYMDNLLHGDLGDSQVYKKPVTEVLKSPLKVTVTINVFVIAFTLIITIFLGIACAVRKNSKFDKTVQVLTIVGYSLPVFIFALLYVYLFAVKLEWFPVSGMRTPNFTGTKWEEFLDLLRHITLPLLVLITRSLGGMTRYVRAAMVDALNMDYIKTARAKGLREKVVIYSHAWRNALLPVITLIISWLMTIFSGSLVTESMFVLHGMGKIYIDSLNNQDWNVALAIQLFYIVMAIVGNLIADLSYGIVDPRVRVNK